MVDIKVTKTAMEIHHEMHARYDSSMDGGSTTVELPAGASSRFLGSAHGKAIPLSKSPNCDNRRLVAGPATSQGNHISKSFNKKR